MQQNVPFSSLQMTEKACKDIEYANTELENIEKNSPLLNHHNTLQPRNQHRKIENAHLNKSTYCLYKFLQEKNGFLRDWIESKKLLTT